MYEDFLREKKYITNVSPRTLEWFEQALRWWTGDPKKTVIKMREAGLSARSINSYRTAINSYLHWSESPHRIPRMKCEEKVPPTFSVADIQTIQRWRPKSRCDRRLQAIMLTLADTGCRIDEVLSIKWNEVDFDNLLLTVTGKGSKQRKIPFSFELRKVLYGYQAGRTKTSKTSSQAANGNPKVSRLLGLKPSDASKTLVEGNRSCSSAEGPFGGLSSRCVFDTSTGRKLLRRNVLRDVKRISTRLGITVPERTLHAFRHTFAVNYLRRGGSVFHLMKQLGHSDITMTRRYCNLSTDDLSSIHERVSLLNEPIHRHQ